MREYIVKEYDTEDYEEFKRNLTNEEAVDLLERISDGWLPSYSFSGEERDFDVYTLHMAIYKAIEVLNGKSDDYDEE